MVSEREALQKETLMPVYVAPEDDQLLCMYEEVKQAAATRTSSIFVRGERFAATTCDLTRLPGPKMILIMHPCLLCTPF